MFPSVNKGGNVKQVLASGCAPPPPTQVQMAVLRGVAHLSGTGCDPAEMLTHKLQLCGKPILQPRPTLKSGEAAEPRFSPTDRAHPELTLNSKYLSPPFSNALSERDTVLPPPTNLLSRQSMKSPRDLHALRKDLGRSAVQH